MLAVNSYQPPVQVRQSYHDLHFRAFLQRVKGLIDLYLLLLLSRKISTQIIWQTLRIEAEALIDLGSGLEKRPDFVLVLKNISDRTLLKHRQGIFLYVPKHIRLH